MQPRQDPELDFDKFDGLSRAQLRDLWRQEFGEEPPVSFGRDLLALGIAHARQKQRYGGHSKSLERNLDALFERVLNGKTGEGASPLLRRGTILVREWQGVRHQVTVTDEGFVWEGRNHDSLSIIARAITGTKWNGPRFFGLRETANGS